MDLDIHTTTADVSVELVSPEKLVIEEHSYSTSLLQLYNCKICHDGFTSRDALFSHKLRCYLELDQSKTEAVDRNVISNELKCKIRSGDELSHLDSEIETVSNDPVEESGADQDENLGSVGQESLICVSETDDEPSNILNDSVEENDINEKEIFSSVSCESPLRVSQPDNQVSTPFDNLVEKVNTNQVEIPDSMCCSSSPLRVPERDKETSTPPKNFVEKADTEQNDIFDSMSYSSSPLRICESDEEISTPLNDLVGKTNTDQNEISDPMSCELPLQACEAVHEPSTSSNRAKETETNQKDPCSMSYESPQRICEVDNETSTSANEADTDHSMHYDLPSDDQVDSKIGINKIQNLYPNIQSVSIDESIQQKIIYFDHSYDASSTNKIDTSEVVKQILFPIDSNTANEFTKEIESNSTSESTKTHQNHVTASFTNDNGIHSNDDLDSTEEEFEEISIEIDIDEITTTEDHSRGTKKSSLLKNSSHCDKCNRNFSTEQALRVHNTLAPRCYGRFKCKQCDYRGRHLHNLKYHVTTEHRRGQFTCHICGKVCNNSISLRSHLRFVHTNKKIISNEKSIPRRPTKTAEYVCDYCQKSFQFKNNLRKHIIQHTYTHKCDQCDKYLVTKQALCLHKMSHSSIPLKCEKCDFTAKHRKIINEHMVKEHGTEGSVNCDICGESFRSKQSLLVHNRTHLAYRTRLRRSRNEFGELVCEYCQKSFNSSVKLRNHNIWHHKIEDAVCEICSRSFRNKNVLRYHLKNAHIKPFKCEICDFSCGAGNALRDHYRVHSGEKPFICDMCDRSFPLKTTLRLHQERCHCICDHCQKEFSTKAVLREHIKSIHFPESNHIPDQRILNGESSKLCDLCNRTYTSEKSLSEHRQRVHNIFEGYTCDHCQQNFRLKNSLRRHIVSTHVLIFKCDKCRKRYDNETELYSHKSTHTSKSKFALPKRFVCGVCWKACATQGHLTTHQRTHMGQKHPKSLTSEVGEAAGATEAHSSTHQPNLVEEFLNQFACEICGYNAKTLNQIQNHLQIFHIGEKPFVCECGKKFSKPKHLKYHQNVHRDAQIYCGVCGVGFRIENTYIDHMRSIHPTESTYQPFTCEICNFSCENLAYLTDHFRVHTGEKPYSCEKCNLRFFTKVTLKSHMLTWHRTLPTVSNVIDTITIDENESTSIENSSNLYIETIYVLHNTNSKDDQTDPSDVPDTAEDLEQISIKIEPNAIGELVKKKKFSTYYRPQLYPCEICHKTFTRACDLLNHDNTDHENIPRIVNCNVCGKLVISKDRLTLHKQKFHTEKIYPCNVCQKKFVSCKSLSKHYEIHYQQFICDHCQKSFRSKTTLLTHIRKHILKQSFNCNKCDKSFSSKAGLHIHERTHSAVKLFKCDKCDFAAKHQSGIYIHTLTRHTTEESIICELCGRSFKNKMRLNEHHKRKHQTPKRYACDKCDYKFKQMYQLRVHYRTHTGEKPFICEICGKGFTRSDGLKEHKRIHHDAAVH